MRRGPFTLNGDLVWSKIGVEGTNVRTRTLAPGVTGMVGQCLGLDVEVGAACKVVRSDR